MVDRGYDLWLGNNRGNKYSKEHINKKKADLAERLRAEQEAINTLKLRW